MYVHACLHAFVCACVRAYVRDCELIPPCHVYPIWTGVVHPLLCNTNYDALICVTDCSSVATDDDYLCDIGWYHQFITHSFTSEYINSNSNNDSVASYRIHLRSMYFNHVTC